MSLKTELKEVRAESSGLKGTSDVSETEGKFHIQGVPLRIDTDRGMLWGITVDFWANSKDEIEDVLMEIFDFLDGRKSKPENNKGGLKSRG